MVKIVGLTTFALYTIGDADVLTSVASTERLFYKTVQPGIGVSVDTNTITINGHSFSNGEPLEYSSNGGTRIGIATATIGAGTTTFLPDKVWAIVSVTDGVLDQKTLNWHLPYQMQMLVLLLLLLVLVLEILILSLYHQNLLLQEQ